MEMGMIGLVSPDLAKFAGCVWDLGKRRWTIKAATDESIPAPVLSAAPDERISSRGEDDFAEKVWSVFHYRFGGYDEKDAADKAGA